MSVGKLYIVATPIGNLSDISQRALDTLQQVDTILCEDTRVTKKLLGHYRIDTPTLSYHQHSDQKKVKQIEDLLTAGKDLALVTDAGTPGISDPGNLLIARLTEPPPFSPRLGGGSEGEGGSSDPSLTLPLKGEGIKIIPIPGPSALTTALSASGFPTDKFVFLGFPPQKNKRQKFFKEVAESKYTVAFYESGHRIDKCLQNLTEVLSEDRQVMIARELTKKFETIYRGTIQELLKQKITDKGEFTVVVSR